MGEPKNPATGGTSGVIRNAEGRTVGYVDENGNIVDTERGGLGGSTATAGARMARRNPAESQRIRNFRRNGR